MFDAIKKYMLIEKINITDDAIRRVVYLSDGAMRDALSILDECIAFYFNDEIDLNKIVKVTGSIENKISFEFIKSLVEKNLENLLKIIEEIITSGKNITKFLSDLIKILHDIIIIDSTENISDEMHFNYDAFLNDIKNINLNFNFDEKINLIKKISELQIKIKYAVNSRIMLEVFCMEFCLCNNKNINKMSDEIYINKNINNYSDNKKLNEVWTKVINKSDAILKEILSLAKVELVGGNKICIMVKDLGSKIILQKKKNEIEDLIKEYLDVDLEFKIKS
jgi:DNA polymerase III gamma/tau subunit